MDSLVATSILVLVLLRVVAIASSTKNSVVIASSYIYRRLEVSYSILYYFY
jgi:hypothetical protein